MRLNTAKMSDTKQVRVDNWGIFFLQRLQLFFSKTDFCDMTLQFEGNVQLKVHRLVMNACTDYFQFLEQTCTLEDNIIMMPSDLQADVIVPIVNFMYTGMLEFQLSIFDKLYKTAELMNIPILIKLLDAQKQPMASMVKSVKKKGIETSHLSTPVKKVTTKADLPATLPGRKLPIWKRKSIPSSSTQPYSHSVSQLCYPEPKWSPSVDPLSVPDNTPKPTRFEWPDEDLPILNLMDTNFEDITYTSKPLLTQEEEIRASTSFDDLKHLPSRNMSSSASKKHSSASLDMEEMKNYVKEQKIRSGLTCNDDENIDDDITIMDHGAQKRKLDMKNKSTVKKAKLDDVETKKTTISIATDGKGTTELNHSKIVSEILKKYPQLVKKNKNIRLKIMAKNKGSPGQAKIENIQLKSPKLKVQASETSKGNSKVGNSKVRMSETDKAPWLCRRCSTEDEPIEFVLYYLYRKHMTDVHNEKFDSRMCKYCGHKCNKQNLLLYHLYTKHGMRPSAHYNFPKCSQCPFIAISDNLLAKHKLRHGKNEMECVECELAFTSSATLTSHMQITGHTGKSNKHNYDCQYCTKRYQSGVNLFSHVRLQHRNEAIRDGIVSIDENDDFEDYDDDDSDLKEEYILPEIISDTSSDKKVNILSNIKVSNRQELPQSTLEPSSEAEALSNVASGIATSLGLVDIVVLNENQQLFLQSGEQSFGAQGEQSEFILPELTGNETFNQDQNEVMTSEGVITQSMLSEGDIASTDELVMVLTDHDYGDNQEEITSDNSNIVVLYSHPVDGQQDQYITTSQSNIMVNSQTGMIEIRNGATITTSTGNQMVMGTDDTHIESIEMIQKEIESHTDLKQDTIYAENKSNTENVVDDHHVIKADQESDQTDLLHETLTENEQLQLDSFCAENNETSDNNDALIHQVTQQPDNALDNNVNEQTVDIDTTEKETTVQNDVAIDEINQMEVDGNNDAKEIEQNDEVDDNATEHADNNERSDNLNNDETIHENADVNDDVGIPEIEDKIKGEPEIKNEIREPLENLNQSVDVLNEENSIPSTPPLPPEIIDGIQDNVENNINETETADAIQDGDVGEGGGDGDEEEGGEEEMECKSEEEREGRGEEEGRAVEEGEVPGRGEGEVPRSGEEEEQQQQEQISIKNENEIDSKPSISENEPIEEKTNQDVEAVAVEEDEINEQLQLSNDNDHCNNDSRSVKGDECGGDDQDLTNLPMDVIEDDQGMRSDSSTKQFTDDTSQSSQESSNKDGTKKTKSNHSTKISILDDWEDTDSQQSDHREGNKAAGGETVNKLMDDWEDDEDDDMKKENDEEH